MLTLVFAPTMEWDTAAGQAIALASGAKSNLIGKPRKTMKYNKENLLNSWFLVETLIKQFFFNSVASEAFIFFLPAKIKLSCLLRKAPSNCAFFLFFGFRNNIWHFNRRSYLINGYKGVISIVA